MKKVLLSLCAGLFLINPVFAENHETSELQNPAQIQKAQNLSDASFKNFQNEISEKQEDVETKQSSYDEKEANLQDAQTAFDNEVSPQTTEALANAQAEFDIANEELDSAKDSLAQVSQTSVEDINEMRLEGMGWGEIAHELGVHPSNLGLGKTMRNKNTEKFSISTEESKEKGLKGKASNSKINNSKNNKNGHANAKGGNGKGANSKGGNGKNK